MVNTVTPSRGCYMCRARRIKCDEGKPSCMRCQKSKRTCPGYRGILELKLRDQTKSTKHRLSSGYRKNPSLIGEEIEVSFGCPYNSLSTLGNIASLPLSCSHSNWIEYDNIPWHDESPSLTNNGNQNHAVQSPRTQMVTRGWYQDRPSLIEQPLATPVDQQAICFFLANYVLVPGPSSTTGRGHLNFLLPLLKSQPANSPLAMTFTSVGLATMAVRPNYRELMPMASSIYIKALKQISVSLKDPSVAMSDTTLATILLLTVFEQITTSGMDLKGWSSHIKGAVAIIKSRGKNGFKTKMGWELFISVRELMTIHYMAKSYPIDPSVEWWINGVEGCEEDEVVQSYTHYNLRVAELRQDNEKTTSLAPQTPANIEAVLALLRRAQDLEEQYRKWYTALPWNPDALAWVDWSDLGLSMAGDLSKSIVHPGRVDAYKELSMAYAYNVARSSQILIWTTILRCVAWLSPNDDYRISEEHKKAALICGALIEDIVASVPYFFGWNAETDPATATRNGRNIDDSIKGVSGIFLIWPLFVAASSDFCSDSQRAFLRGRLTFIAENMGICQARILLTSPLRHPSLHIMHERMNLKMSSSKSPSPMFSNANLTATSTSLIMAEASRRMSTASSIGR